jgi:hypothetical protein
MILHCGRRSKLAPTRGGRYRSWHCQYFTLSPRSGIYPGASRGPRSSSRSTDPGRRQRGSKRPVKQLPRAPLGADRRHSSGLAAARLDPHGRTLRDGRARGSQDRQQDRAGAWQRRQTTPPEGEPQPKHPRPRPGQFRQQTLLTRRSNVAVEWWPSILPRARRLACGVLDAGSRESQAIICSIACGHQTTLIRQ